MHTLPSATTVCRVLHRLDRSQASGTLHLRGEGRGATLSFECGRIWGANVDHRVASSHRQLLDGLLRLCEWDRLVLRLIQEPVGATWWKLRQPMPGRVLALRVMQAAVRDVDAATVRSDLGREVYHLTSAGESLVDGADLRPEQSAAVALLRHGVRAEDVLRMPGCGLVGYRFVWMLKMLRVVAPKASGSYPLLLRKRREMRRRAPAHALLDLPEGAGGREARRALRKLVRDLHPDRFGSGTPAGLRRASSEIVAALVDAQTMLANDSAD